MEEFDWCTLPPSPPPSCPTTHPPTHPPKHPPTHPHTHICLSVCQPLAPDLSSRPTPPPLPISIITTTPCVQVKQQLLDRKLGADVAEEAIAELRRAAETTIRKGTPVKYIATEVCQQRKGLLQFSAAARQMVWSVARSKQCQRTALSLLVKWVRGSCLSCGVLLVMGKVCWRSEGGGVIMNNDYVLHPYRERESHTQRGVLLVV